MPGNKFSLAILFIGMVGLAACGSGGGETDGEVSGFTDIDSDVRMVSIKNGTTILQYVGNVDVANSALTLNGNLATLADDRTSAAYSDGTLGTLTFDLDGPTDYVVSVEGSLSETGIIGIPSTSAELPLGTFFYNGRAQLLLIDTSDNSLFDLDGDVAIEANFDGQRLHVDLTNMNGQLTRGANAPVDVVDAVDVSIREGVISGSGFESGTVTISSPSGDLGSTLSAGVILSHVGGFFGPSADEVGGVAIIDDAVTGSIVARTVYLAD